MVQNFTTLAYLCFIKTLAGYWIIHNVHCLFDMLLSVFPKDSDADRQALHPHKHPLHTARLTGPHGSRLPRQPTNHDDHGTHAFSLPTSCTVLHPTGDTGTLK